MSEHDTQAPAHQAAAPIQHIHTPDLRTHKQVIVMRKDLGMTAGKMVAQGAHASLGAILDQGEHRVVDGRPAIVIYLDDPRSAPWLLGSFAKIGARVESEAELLALHEKAKTAGIITTLITDAGLTHFGGVATTTAIAIGPDFKHVIDPVTSHLRLL